MTVGRASSLAVGRKWLGQSTIYTRHECTRPKQRYMTKARAGEEQDADGLAYQNTPYMRKSYLNGGL